MTATATRALALAAATTTQQHQQQQQQKRTATHTTHDYLVALPFSTGSPVPKCCCGLHNAVRHCVESTCEPLEGLLFQPGRWRWCFCHPRLSHTSYAFSKACHVAFVIRFNPFLKSIINNSPVATRQAPTTPEGNYILPPTHR